MSSFPSNEELQKLPNKGEAGPILISALKNNNHPNWGFVLCRITYSNQPKWDEFVAEFKKMALKSVRDDDYATQLEEHLEWTVLEDKERLNGATMLEASHYFLEWVEHDPVTPVEEQPSYLRRTLVVSYPRHNIFIYGCAETVDSVVDPVRRNDFKNGNFVHLVNAPRCVHNADYASAHNASPNDDAWLRTNAEFCSSMYANLADPNNWYHQRIKHPSIVYW